MAITLGSYSPDDVDVIINDKPLQGLAREEFVRAERTNEEEFRAETGAKGDFTFIENLDKSGRIIVSLEQNSEDNVYLSNLLAGKAVFTAEIRSRHNFQEVASSKTSMIGVRPRKAFGQSVTVREWVISCGAIEETDKAN